MKTIIKKIHMILGLTGAVFLTLIGITGALLSFQQELLELVNPKIYDIAHTNNRPLNRAELINKIKDDNNLIISAIRFYNDPDKPIVLVTPPAENAKSKRKVLYYVNPYTGEINKGLVGQKFFHYVRYIHLDLMSGKIGKNIVAFSTIFLVALSISGIWLYWKPLKNNFISAIKIDLKSRGRKLYFKLHTVFGTILFIPLLVISLSGLFWSYDWYKACVYSLCKVEAPKAVSGNFKGHRKPSSIDIDKAIKSFNFFNEHAKSSFYELTIRGIRNSDYFKISYLDKKHRRSEAQNTIIFDAANERRISHDKYAEQKIGEKIINSMLSIHNGAFFGVFFKLLFFIASLSLTLFSVTGVLLYIGRKKGRKI